jgi:hypothetical protein
MYLGCDPIADDAYELCAPGDYRLTRYSDQIRGTVGTRH